MPNDELSSTRRYAVWCRGSPITSTLDSQLPAVVTDALKACDVVESWLRANAVRLGWTERQFKRRHELGQFAAAYEVDDLLFTFAAWDNANCFDIDLIDTRTRAAEIICAGPTAGKREIVEKIEAFVARIEGRKRI